MIAGVTRDEAERDLGRALSRHIGYTTGAFDLDRIFSVVAYFRTETSGYGAEISETLGRGPGGKALSASYLNGVIEFATAFGLVEAVSSRESKLTRYAATELGRSVLGVLTDQDTDFRKHYLATVVLMADADYLVPLMVHINDGGQKPLQDDFLAFAIDLRTRRYDWLRKTLTQPVLLERTAAHIPWLKKAKAGIQPYTIAEPLPSTVRHHSKPRLGWLSDLGFLDQNSGRLTPFGLDVLNAVVGDQAYFWIGPDPVSMATLGVKDPVDQAKETDLGLTPRSTPEPSAAERNMLASDTAALMIRAFGSAKLIHADQASLRLPIAYIQYRAYRDGRRYDWVAVLTQVFDTERDRLRRYSAHKGHVGFYKVVPA